MSFIHDLIVFIVLVILFCAALISTSMLQASYERSEYLKRAGQIGEAKGWMQIHNSALFVAFVSVIGISYIIAWVVG